MKEGAFESRNENKNIVNYFRHPGRATALTDFMNINEAFVEIVRLVKSCKTKLKMFFRDFESQAMQSGSEDPEVASLLQKCEEYVPGKVASMLWLWSRWCFR